MHRVVPGYEGVHRGVRRARYPGGDHRRLPQGAGGIVQRGTPCVERHDGLPVERTLAGERVVEDGVAERLPELELIENREVARLPQQGERRLVPATSLEHEFEQWGREQGISRGIRRR